MFPFSPQEPLGPSDREVCSGSARGALMAQRRTRPRGLPASIPLMTRMDRPDRPLGDRTPFSHLPSPILGPASADPN